MFSQCYAGTGRELTLTSEGIVVKDELTAEGQGSPGMSADGSPAAMQRETSGATPALLAEGGEFIFEMVERMSND